MNRIPWIAASIGLMLLTGCVEDKDERYDAGFSDGHAEGYNSTCGKRTSLVEGDWDSNAYSKGYAEGRASGVAQCEAEKDN